MLTNLKSQEMNHEGMSGICASCLHRDDCVMTHGGQTQYDCNEYEAAESKTPKGYFKMESRSVPNLGLCADCMEKDECHHKSVPGGVWHCESYR